MNDLRENPVIQMLAKDPAVVKTAARILKHGWSEKEENVEITKAFEPSAKPLGNVNISYDKWKPSGPGEPVPANNENNIRLRRDKLSDGDYVTLLKEMISIMENEVTEVSKGIKTDDKSGAVPDGTEDIGTETISIEE